MAIKTFTTGEVLTASDTNTYLANAGLDFVKQQTIGTGVSSITISNAFSATWDNYRIVVSGGVFSGNVPVQFKVGPSSPATGYYAMLIYASYGGSVTNASVSNGGVWNWMGFGSSGGIGATVDILTPFASKNTFCVAGTYNHVGGGGTCQGILGNTNSYTDLIVQPESGTATGGTITVYGYRKG
jgi:hypothetical protein